MVAKREYHLHADAAANLVQGVLDAYTKDHEKPPAELFIHDSRKATFFR